MSEGPSKISKITKLAKVKEIRSRIDETIHKSCSRCQKPLGLRRINPEYVWDIEGKLCKECYNYLISNTVNFSSTCYISDMSEDPIDGILSLQSFDEKGITFSAEKEQIFLHIPKPYVVSSQIVEKEGKSTRRKIMTLGLQSKTKHKFLEIKFLDKTRTEKIMSIKTKYAEDVYEDLQYILENNEMAIAKEYLLEPGSSFRNYGKIILVTANGLYYGGHNAYLAGGKFSDSQNGIMILTSDYFVFLKNSFRKSKSWEIVIPLRSIIKEDWKIDEKTRRQTIHAVPTFPLSVGAIHNEGKAHDIVIPYTDENGLAQYPRFGVSSLTGNAIKTWAKMLYDLVSPQGSQPLESEKTSGPLYHLKVRLAKGEISKEEYEELRKLLE